MGVTIEDMKGKLGIQTIAYLTFRAHKLFDSLPTLATNGSFPDRGPQYRPKNITILTMGTPEMVPLILGGP